MNAFGPPSAALPQQRSITPLPPEQPAWGNIAVGTILGGSYRLTRKLAQGGMGDIYLASHERLPGVFVVKVLSPDLAHDSEAFLRFQREAVVMTAIRHPNVVQVVDFNSTDNGMPYLVMEYLQGQDLAQILAERRSLTPKEVSRIVRKVSCGLDAAHRLGIVHRDLKPENIMVVPCPGQLDVVKVIDFGISKARRWGQVTNTSTVIGTPEFMSPEQAQGRQDDVDARSDQFALAVITYLLLTGQTPWGTAEPVETLRRVVNNPPLPMGTHVVGSFAGVESVLFRAMAKRPADRYPSTLAFSRALDRALVVDGLLTDAATTESSTSVTPVPAFGSAGVVAPPSSRAWDDVAFGQANSDDVHGGQNVQEGFVEFDATNSAAQELPVTGGSLGLLQTAGKAPRPRRRQRRRSRYAWEGLVLFLALLGGTSIGFLDLPTVRAQGTRGLGVVRSLVAGVQQSTASGVHTLTNVWRGASALAGGSEKR